MKRGLGGLLLAGVMVLSLAGCGGGSDGPSGSGSVGDAPAASGTSAPADAGTTPAPAPAATTPPAPAAPAPLTCGQLATAAVGSASIGLADYDAGAVVLAGGRYTDSTGRLVALQPPCGIGDLNGDGAADAIGAVKISSGGTGQFWTLVAWANNAGNPQLTASKALGDRNPVTDITVAGQRATVVYLTRTPDVPMAGVNLKRTAIYQLSGGSLTEVSHTDVPYTP
jgi:hypothetical protein